MNRYFRLIRWDRPVGNLLLLWPTLTAVWLASGGRPSALVLFVFVVGVFVMRAAGCIVNDIVDRRLDHHVSRTERRPLAIGEVSLKSALFLLAGLLLVGLFLVLLLNCLALWFAIVGVIFTIIYPWLKRITDLPQLGLGIAFNWGIFMAYAAEQGGIPIIAQWYFLTMVLWTVMYDTLYAMVDREDDIKIGIKSTAIFLGEWDRWILLILQIIIIGLLIFLGSAYELSGWYYAGVFACTMSFILQQYWIRDRKPESCLKAFMNNQWSLLFIFFGVVLSFL